MERNLRFSGASAPRTVVVQGPPSGFGHAALAERGVDLWLAGNPDYRRRDDDAQRLLERFAARGHAIWAEQRGRFVAIVHERPASLVHVVTDRWAAIPVYRSANPAGVALSLSLRDGIRAGLHPVRWDLEGIAELTSLGQCLRDRTVLADVRRLPRASVTHFDLGSGAETSEAYWSAERVLAGPRERIGVLADELLARFREAVDAQSDDGPVFTTLSGGLDTRVITAALVASGRRPCAFTIGVPGGRDDRNARRVSHELGIEQRFVAIDAASIGDQLPLMREAALRLDARGLIEGLGIRRLMREVGPDATIFQGAFAELGKLEGAHEVRVRFGRVPPSAALPAAVAGCFARNFDGIRTVLAPAHRDAVQPIDAIAARVREFAERMPAVEALTAFYLEERLEQALASHAVYGAADRVAAPFADPFFVDTLLRVRGSDRIRPLLHQRFLRALAPKLLAIPDSNTGLPAWVPGPLRDLGRTVQVVALKAGIGWAQAHDDYCAKLLRLEPDARTLLRGGRLVADGVLEMGGVDALARRVEEERSERAASTLQRVVMFDLWATSLAEP